MKLNIKDINGKSVGDVSVSKDVFGIEPNLPVVRQAILSELNNMRQGTHSAPKTELWLMVVEKNLGSKKDVELQELVLFVLLYGKVVVLYLGLSLTPTIISYQKN